MAVLTHSQSPINQQWKEQTTKQKEQDACGKQQAEGTANPRNIKLKANLQNTEYYWPVGDENKK